MTTLSSVNIRYWVNPEYHQHCAAKALGLLRRFRLITPQSVAYLIHGRSTRIDERIRIIARILRRSSSVDGTWHTIEVILGYRLNRLKTEELRAMDPARLPESTPHPLLQEIDALQRQLDEALNSSSAPLR